MRVILDRIEKGFGIVELPDHTTVNMPEKLLPEGIKEGDVIDILINHESTAKRAADIEKKLHKLFKD